MIEANLKPTDPQAPWLISARSLPLFYGKQWTWVRTFPCKAAAALIKL